MPRINTIDFINEAIKELEADYAKSPDSNWVKKHYTNNMPRLNKEKAEELAEPSYFEYKAVKNKIDVNVVRLDRGIDMKFTIDLSELIKDCIEKVSYCTYDSKPIQHLDKEEFTCYIMGELEFNTSGINEYFGKDHPSNKDDFKQWDKQQWALIDYCDKRIKKLLK